MLMGASPGKPWAPAETRQSAMVFISRNLPRALLQTGLAPCIAASSAPVTPRSEAKVA